MSEHKKPFMDAIVKAVLRLSLLEKMTRNPYTKKEIQDEMSSLIIIMVSLESFQLFLLDLLLKDSIIETQNIKTGPLGNRFPEDETHESDK